MKNLSTITLIFLAFVLTAQTLVAQSTKKISIQGILKDGDGAAVPDGDYSLTFSLYDALSGGTLKWDEVQPTVRVRGGVYSALLGAVEDFNTGGNTAIFDVPYFLGVKVNGGDELTPRTELSYAPYALAVNNAATSTLAAKASTLAGGGGNGTAMTFTWSGQPGQATWLWGTNDGINTYVWNPSNFNVNYANLAGTANALKSSGTGAAMTFHWSGQNGQPMWLWGGTDGVNHYVYNPSNFNVNYANTAGNVSTGADVVINSLRATGNRPDYAPYTQGQGSAYLNSGGVAGAGGLHAFDNGFSIVTNGNMGASHYFAFSDKRIKTDIQATDPESDLRALTQLEVVDYRYLDYVSKGYNSNKGLIAQQVQSIFPEAVTVQSDAIPDIYAISLSIDHTQNESIITMEKDHGLKLGDRVKLILDKGEELFIVKTCTGPKQFGIEGLSPELKNVFVYGKEVDDFLSVDYDRIYTLGISVIQQLVKNVSTLEEENESLRAEQAKFKEMMTSMASRLSLLEKTSASKVTKSTVLSSDQ